jgi:predicted aldo/keto reductase-like oxidoreductase
MIYREYGKTAKKVSVLGFGGMRFKDVNNTDLCVEMMVEAAKGGVNYFDTAPKYFGVKSETAFGLGFRELKRLGLPFYCSTKTSESTESGISRELEQQLRRLGLERIDFYHVWCITSLDNWQQRKNNGALKAFQKLKEEGLIGHICVSSHLIGDQIKELLMEGVFEGVLFGYSAYNYRVRQAAFEAITKHNLGCVIMNPLGGGLIPQNPRLFEFLKTQQQETAVEAAIRFLIAHERISVVLVGFGNRDEVKEALSAVEGYRPITSETLESLKARSAGALDGICTGCRYCDHCPEGIPVPKLMDAYNMRILYKKDHDVLDRLRWHWSVSPEEAGRCTECGECERRCTQHLDIIDRLKEILAINR